MSMRAYVARDSKGTPQVEEVAKPKIEKPTEILVEVHAVATNPVDMKRVSWKTDDSPLIVGWDCSGVVVEVGSEVRGFKVGDEVYYTGNVNVTGNFSEFHTVDYRLVAKKPKSLTHLQAAAFPLVAVTAYEALYENMDLENPKHKGKSIFIYPGAGGVGAISIQLAKLAGLKVIASASRDETREFVTKMGADVVIDHTKDLVEEFKIHNLPPVDFVFNTYSEKEIPRLIPIVKPRGHIVGLNADAEVSQQAVMASFVRRLHLSFENMSSRALFEYEVEEVGKLLNRVAKWIDSGKIQRIDATSFHGGLEQLGEAEKLQTSGKAIGKIVVGVKEDASQATSAASAASLPSTIRQWRLPKAGSGVDSLQLVSDLPLPTPGKGEVLVRVHACSLNYRDLVLADTTFQPTLDDVIPLSDGAGEVVALGEGVSEWGVGDRVCATLCPSHQDGEDGLVGAGLPPCLGGMLQGMLSEYIVLAETALVRIPSHLSYEQAATLPCAGVTAWTALRHGPQGMQPGNVVLVQGTGGVSVLAAQLAKAAGCRVIATSSSGAKLQRLQDMGVVEASDCINYKSTPNWGEAVKALTPEQRGVHQVIDVAGPGSISQSLTAVRRGGEVALVGLLDHGSPDQKGLDYIQILMNLITIRGVLVGPRSHFKELMAAIEEGQIQPVVDCTFPFEQAKEAYEFVKEGKHFAKVVIAV